MQETLFPRLSFWRYVNLTSYGSSDKTVEILQFFWRISTFQRINTFIFEGMNGTIVFLVDDCFLMKNQCSLWSCDNDSHSFKMVMWCCKSRCRVHCRPALRTQELHRRATSRRTSIETHAHKHRVHVVYTDPMFVCVWACVARARPLVACVCSYGLHNKPQQRGAARHGTHNKIQKSLNLVAVLLYAALACVFDVVHCVPHCCGLCNNTGPWALKVFFTLKTMPFSVFSIFCYQVLHLSTEELIFLYNQMEQRWFDY